MTLPDCQSTRPPVLTWCPDGCEDGRHSSCASSDTHDRQLHMRWAGDGARQASPDPQSGRAGWCVEMMLASSVQRLHSSITPGGGVKESPTKETQEPGAIFRCYPGSTLSCKMHVAASQKERCYFWPKPPCCIGKYAAGYWRDRQRPTARGWCRRLAEHKSSSTVDPNAQPRSFAICTSVVDH